MDEKNMDEKKVDDKKQKKKRVTFTFDEESVELLKEVSKKTMIPQSRLVEKALEKIFKEYKEKL